MNALFALPLQNQNIMIKDATMRPLISKEKDKLERIKIVYSVEKINIIVSTSMVCLKKQY